MDFLDVKFLWCTQPVFILEETPINKFPQKNVIFSPRLIIMCTMFTEKDS